MPLPENGPLFLQLDVDVQERQRLLRHYDLENFLTPLFGSRCLPSARFHLVAAKKYVGGGSRISLGKVLTSPSTENEGWSTFTLNAGRGASSKLWKERIRSALEANNITVIPPGPARVRLAWKCASRRNWSTLWKPTGDSMGPVLGVANPLRPYHLDDDRIVDLELHRNIADEVGHDVEVGMWWRSASITYKQARVVPAINVQTDDEYQRWRDNHPSGFVLNTTRPESARCMVLHRASCTYIGEPSRENAPGGFTERSYQKIVAEDVESLRDWVATHGRPDRTFSNECGTCKPI